MSELYENIPGKIIDSPDDLGLYAAWMDKEKSLTTFKPALKATNAIGEEALNRMDKTSDLLKILQTPQLTEEVRTGILTRIRRGVIPADAAAAEGIVSKLWFQWMGWALNNQEPWRTFYVECMKAEAASQEDAQDVLRGDVGGAKFLLERRFSRPSLAEDPLYRGAKWRKQTNQEITLSVGEDGPKLSAMKPKERAIAVAALKAEMAKLDAISMADEDEDR